MFADLTKGIFDADLKTPVNVYRQYLQTSFVESLLFILNDQYSYDEIAKAAALNTVQNIKAELATAVRIEGGRRQRLRAGNRAHLMFLIDKTLKKD